MKEDLVSVIMPTYNAGKFLADSIQCILRQTYDNLELIITDDASTDEDTIKILKEFAQADKRVKIELLSENHGPGYARNACIKRAEGRYIAFCDCDDRWIPEKLEIQINYMSEKKCALCCATYLICNSNYETTGINIPPRRITYKMIKRDNKIGCLTAIYDTKALGKKYYMPTIRKRQDWAMFIQILQQCKICYAYTKKPLAYYCVRKNSVSRKKMQLIYYNVTVYENILKFSRIKSYLYFFLLFLPSYGCKVLKRKIDSIQYMKTQNISHKIV